MRDPIKCADCSTVIKDPWPAQIRCTTCAHKKQHEQARANSKRRYNEHKKLPAEEKPVTAPARASAEAWDLKGKSVTQIETEARALGLSYGKYVAMINCGMIDRHCRDMGVDGLKVVDAAWKEHKRHKAEEEKRRAEKRGCL